MKIYHQALTSLTLRHLLQVPFKKKQETKAILEALHVIQLPDSIPLSPSPAVSTT